MPINTSGAALSVLGTIAGAKTAYEHLQNQAKSELSSATEALAGAKEHKNIQQEQYNNLQSQLAKDIVNRPDDVIETELEKIMEQEPKALTGSQDAKKKYDDYLAKFNDENPMNKGNKLYAGKLKKAKEKAYDNWSGLVTSKAKLMMEQEVRQRMRDSIKERQETLQLANEKVTRAQERLDKAKENKYLKGGKK